MNHVEVEGISIDDAIEKALQTLGVTRERAEIEILASPTKGVLGIGSRKARVRATIREPLSMDPFAHATRSEDVPAPTAEPRSTTQSGYGEAPRSPEGESFAIRARALLEEVLGRMGFAVSVETNEEEEGVHLTIRGDGSGVLIGRHGRTLDALEYFVHRALSREEEGGRISVDCEDYRIRRRESLEASATRLAQQVKAKRKPMTMEALSPRDRRVVHLLLQAEPDVSTHSSGEGYYRKLVISPSAQRHSPRPQRSAHRSGNR